MYLLDTNVVSEIRKGQSHKADVNVIEWADSVPAASLFLSVISVLEIEIGVLLAERRDPAQGSVLRSWLNLACDVSVCWSHPARRYGSRATLRKAPCP